MTQTRLDKVQLNLPLQYSWEKQMDMFRADSTVRVQGWFILNEQGQKVRAAIILSMDKAEMSASFQEFIKQRLGTVNKSQDITLLEEGKTTAGYPYVLFKALVTKDNKNDPGSFIVIFIETETSIHSLSIRSIKSNHSDELVAEWSGILKNSEITPGSAAVEVKQTQFILNTPKRESRADSTITEHLRRRFEARLKDVYERNLSPQDFRFDEGRIYITLCGDIDRKTISKLLDINNSVQFFPLYRDTGY